MKRWIWKTGALLLAVGLLGVLAIVSGLIPITASSGHWPITAWFLHFTMKRSVATHSLWVEVPALDDPGLVLKGAAHYEIGCFPCHGSPAMKQPRIAQQMTPPPPYLPPRIAGWDAKELFYIVKHGVKFTGMPAWPSQQRDDEVWAMVAFLQKLPDLDAAGYRRLVHGEPAAAAPLETLGGVQQAPSAAAQSCMQCHGSDGLGRGSGAFPKLAGQRAEYLQNALKAYARGERHSGIMGPIAAGLSAETIRALARHYSELNVPPPSPPAQQNSAAIARGQSIAEHGIPHQRVPSCIDCHGAGARRGKPAYPVLAGQPADYLVLQLKLFKKGQRGGSEYAHLMHPVATRLTHEQMRDVALYLESLERPNERGAE